MTRFNVSRFCRKNSVSVRHEAEASRTQAVRNFLQNSVETSERQTPLRMMGDQFRPPPETPRTSESTLIPRGLREAVN